MTYDRTKPGHGHHSPWIQDTSTALHLYMTMNRSCCLVIIPGQIFLKYLSFLCSKCLSTRKEHRGRGLFRKAPE
jgi:hypothetical protein